MSLRVSLSSYWCAFQEYLFPIIEDDLGPLGERYQSFITVPELVRVEQHLPCFRTLRGRPQQDRVAMARAFIGKAVFQIDTTRALLERLANDRALRYLCGWSSILNDGDGVDLDPVVVGQAGLDRGAGGAWLGEERLVYGVQFRKQRHVGEIDGDFEHLLHRRAAGLDQGLEVGQRLARLGGEVAFNLGAGGRLHAHLARDEQQFTVADGGGVGAGRSRAAVRADRRPGACWIATGSRTIGWDGPRAAPSGGGLGALVHIVLLLQRARG